jgi:hypothetical protein
MLRLISSDQSIDVPYNDVAVIVDVTIDGRFRICALNMIVMIN